MKKLISLLQGKKTADEKVIILEDRRKDLMAEILDFEDSERPTQPLKKKLSDLDRDLEIAKQRAGRAEAKAFDIALGLVDTDIKNYSGDLKAYEDIRADFQERSGDCLAQAVYYLTELQEMDLVGGINKLFLGAFDEPTPGLEKISEIFNRKYEPKSNENLLERRQKLQQIEQVKKSAATKSYLAKKLIRRASEDVR